MMEIRGKHIFGAVLLPTGWGMMLLSIALYMLFWRVDNEPGAQAVPGLLWAAIGSVSLGTLAFLGSHIYLIITKSWLLLLFAWVACGALLIVSVYLLPILLLLMV